MRSHDFVMFALFGTKVQTSTPFLRDPEILQTCLMCPCRAFYDFCFSLRRKCGIPFKTQTSHKKYKKNIIWRKTHIRKRLGRGTLNTCAKFQGLSQKRRGHWTPNEFGAISLNQPVLVCTYEQSAGIHALAAG